MKTQTRTTRNPGVSTCARTLAGAALVVLMASMLVGCSVTNTRVITATHWGAQQTGASGAQRAQQPEAAPVDNAEGQGGEQPVAAQPVAIAAAPAGANGYTDMTLYIGYTQTTTSEMMTISDDNAPLAVESRMRFCNLKEDASLVCTESPDLNRMLNPHIYEARR